MGFTLGNLLYALVLCVTVGQVRCVPTSARASALSACPRKYSDYNIHHTACLLPRQGADKPVMEGVSRSSREYIVNLHNHYRSNVHNYNNQPTATNMQMIYWDDELAMIAQKWASNCMWGHDESANRTVPGKYAVGQNLGRGHRGWGTVMSHWQSEVNYMTFGVGKEAGKPIGHYTQMVWAETSRVGCGYARCNRTQSYYVCNYGPTGNMNSRKYSPYESGPTKEKCSANTSNNTPGLCDCKGKVCLNGGRLDLKTCECDCPNKPWVKQGGDCSIDCSKAEDMFPCATKGGSWGETDCGKYVNIPYEYCPIMCKLCPAESVIGAALPPATTTEKPLPTTDIFGNTGGKAGNKPLIQLRPTSAFPLGLANESIWEAVLNGNGGHRNTIPAPGLQTTPEAADARVPTAAPPADRKPSLPTTRQPPPPSTQSPAVAEAEAMDVLPSCKSPVEEAKCGQPSARGFYNPKHCSFGLDHYCPALCGKCTVRSCVDYENNSYGIGEKWMTEYGELTCTTGGVKVKRGCHIEKVGVVISEGEEYSYVDGKIRWRCVCSEGFSLSCKGVWTPTATRRRLV